MYPENDYPNMYQPNYGQGDYSPQTPWLQQGATSGLMSALPKLTGIAGLAAGPFGPLIGAGIGGLVGLLGGDGGKGKRLKEAQAGYRGFANAQVNPGDLVRGGDAYSRAMRPEMVRTRMDAAKRIGLDSGLGEGYALGKIEDMKGAHLAQLYQQLIRQRDEDRRFGVQGLASLVG